MSRVIDVTIHKVNKVNTDGRGDITSSEARDIHANRRQLDPDHDMVGCWCCCLDCDFDAHAVWANDRTAGIESVV